MRRRAPAPADAPGVVPEREPSHLPTERERYRRLFDAAPVAYCVTDRGGLIREANARFAESLGMGARHLVGESLGRYVDPEDRRRFRRRLVALRDGKPGGAWEADVASAAGRRFRAELTVALAPEVGDGDLLWVVRDVTELRQAEEEVRRLSRELEQRVSEHTTDLERERAQLEAVIRQFPAGIAIVEAPSGRVLLANRLATPFLQGAPPTRTDGQPFQPEEFPLARALAGETVAHVQMHLSGEDGASTVVEASAGPVRTQGKIVAAVVVFIDVTDRERARQAVRDFVTNAAHELQTPLAAIVSATDVLQSGAKEIPEDRDRFLAHVERQCMRLTRLVRALLVLARTQSGSEAARAEVIPLHDLLEEVAADIEPNATVPIQIDCAEDAALIANADLARLAVVNLVANAARHTARGRIVVAGRLDGERAVVEVRDTGGGVAEEHRAHLFDRFYRVDDRSDGGFGLGLAIVREVASALGGDVQLESADDVGTTVRMTLPGARLVDP